MPRDSLSNNEEMSQLIQPKGAKCKKLYTTVKNQELKNYNPKLINVKT